MHRTAKYSLPDVTVCQVKYWLLQLNRVEKTFQKDLLQDIAN